MFDTYRAICELKWPFLRQRISINVYVWFRTATNDLLFAIKSIEQQAYVLKRFFSFLILFFLIYFEENMSWFEFWTLFTSFSTSINQR